jgi:two-component system sensor histidine kinase UhpB
MVLMNSVGRQAKRPFKAAEAAHHAVMASMGDAMLTIDEHHRIVMVNPAASQLLGCGADEVLGSKLTRFIPQWQSDDLAIKPAPGAVQGFGGRSIVMGLKADGQAFPTELAVCRQAVLSELGLLKCSTVLLRPSGVQAQIESLTKSLRAIFELAPVAVWITDGELIVYANQACVSLFGAPDRQSLIGRSIYGLLAPESHSGIRKKLDPALLKGESISMLTERIARLDGGVRDVLITVAALPDHGHCAAQMVIMDMTEKAAEHQELMRSRSELQRLMSERVVAREDERRRIARELHDELGQSLTAIKMALARMVNLRSEAQISQVTDVMIMVDQTMASVRRIATELRPLMLDDLGLKASIESLVGDAQHRMGIPVDLHMDEAVPLRLNDLASVAVYRIVQEALTNIARHAKAHRANIDLRIQADQLRLTIRDDGVGLSSEAIHRVGAHGLLGIRERAQLLGGDMAIGNGMDGGSIISVWLPLTDASRAEPVTGAEVKGWGFCSFNPFEP